MCVYFLLIMTTIIHHMIKWWRTASVSHTWSMQHWHFKANSGFLHNKTVLISNRNRYRTPKCIYSWIVPKILFRVWVAYIKLGMCDGIELNQIDYLCSFKPKMRWKSFDSPFLWGSHVIYVKRHCNKHMIARDFHPLPTLIVDPEETVGIMKGLKAVSSQVGAHSALARLQKSSIHS